MKFNNYLKQPLVQKTVMEFAQEIHPLIEETAEKLDANQWEIAATLIIELSGVVAGGELDKETVLEFLSYLIDETTENLEDFEFLQDTNFTTKH